jgi:hypothetical protein
MKVLSVSVKVSWTFVTTAPLTGVVAFGRSASEVAMAEKMMRRMKMGRENVRVRPQPSGTSLAPSRAGWRISR